MALFFKDVCDNIRDTLDEAYYKQPRKKTIGYNEVTIRDYFKHIDEKWCKMDTATIKRMKEK